jgi:hypothetical protein
MDRKTAVGLLDRLHKAQNEFNAAAAPLRLGSSSLRTSGGPFQATIESREHRGLEPLGLETRVLVDVHLQQASLPRVEIDAGPAGATTTVPARTTCC